MATDARALAAALAAATDADLRAIFTARAVPMTAPWSNFFDAADALLQPAAIAEALGRVRRDTAHRLSLSSEITTEDLEALRLLALVDGDGEVLPAVRSAIDELPAPSDAIDHPTPIDSASAAERALVTVSAIADLILLSYTNPVARIGTGAIGSSERKRLIDSGIVADADDVDAVMELARVAGLLAPVEREWLVTPEAATWLALPSDRRWDTLRAAFLHVLPAPLFIDDVLLGSAAWADAFPWSATWPEIHIRLLRTAVLLGLIDATTGRSTAWAHRNAPDIAALVAHLPHEVDCVFLQNDLSVIAPGPLAPALDLRLRAMATRESQAQASTYRFTSESVQHALSRGETEESIVEFLTALSLTGIPQPLRYLVHESATRHGSIRVSHEHEGARSRIRVATPALAQTLLVDQTLRPLGLTPHGTDLLSRVARDTVALALADAHYPVALVGENGEFEPLQRGRVSGEAAAPTPPYSDLLLRVRSADFADIEAAWLTRELEQAVRARAVVSVTVALPDGAERTFTLEAAGLGGGRLRGRDKAADVERTLPVSHIVRLQVADTAAAN